MMQAYQRSYQKYTVQSSSPEDIMLQLMEGGVSRLNRARACWTDGEETRARELRSQALAIITELDSSLDRENGPKDVVDELEALYAYMEREIAASAPKDDFDRLQPVQEVFESIHRAFEAATAEYKQDQAQEAQEEAVPAPEVDADAPRVEGALNLQM